MLPEMYLHIILLSSRICIGDNFPVIKFWFIPRTTRTDKPDHAGE